MKKLGRFDFCWHGFVLGTLVGACLMEIHSKWPVLNIPALLWGIGASSYFIVLTYKAYTDDEDDEA